MMAPAPPHGPTKAACKMPSVQAPQTCVADAETPHDHVAVHVMAFVVMVMGCCSQHSGLAWTVRIGGTGCTCTCARDRRRCPRVRLQRHYERLAVVVGCRRLHLPELATCATPVSMAPPRVNDLPGHTHHMHTQNQQLRAFVAVSECVCSWWARSCDTCSTATPRVRSRTSSLNANHTTLHWPVHSSCLSARVRVESANRVHAHVQNMAWTSAGATDALRVYLAAAGRRM